MRGEEHYLQATINRVFHLNFLKYSYSLGSGLEPADVGEQIVFSSTVNAFQRREFVVSVQFIIAVSVVQMTFTGGVVVRVAVSRSV